MADRGPRLSFLLQAAERCYLEHANSHEGGGLGWPVLDRQKTGTRKVQFVWDDVSYSM